MSGRQHERCGMTNTASERDEFVERTEPFRRELLAHCYRMLGSLDEAEDLVQETYLRAWRAYARFEGRASLRTWMYRIATNACLSALEDRGRRVLPSGLGGPASDPDAPATSSEPEVAWLQPLPDALITSDSKDPAAIVVERESIRLALIAALQALAPRQRATFILREVLDMPASEVAEMLDTTVAAVKSALQRARARLDQLEPAREALSEPTEPRVRELLEEYIAGFEHADTAALERALRSDAAIEMVGSRTWFAGRTTCLRFLERVIGSAGNWRMLATRANGQPAVAGYLRSRDDSYNAYGLALLSMTPAGIDRIVVFAAEDLVSRSGLWRTVPVG
jgi:RNA polymerase sigma-70 factor (ECF subfamily)